MYDSERRQAFAARDPSGNQELYFCLDPDDGSVAFTNSLEQLPAGEPLSNWQELPPGHYISGRTPTLRQFALTPKQLESFRERHSSGDVDSLLEGEVEEDVLSRVSPTSNSKPGLFARLSRKIPGM